MGIPAKAFWAAALLLFCFAPAYPLSHRSTVSIITESPGEDLYMLFGHAVIRVRDPEISLDETFSFGDFSFDTPFFYWKFIRGSLLYTEDIEPFDTFISSYSAKNRLLQEQILDINLSQRNTIYANLVNTYHSAARLYLYDFIYNNCATKIRDAVLKGLYPSSPFPTTIMKTAPTFRSLLAVHLASSPWTHFGVDLVLGMPVDKKTSVYTICFLPRYLHNTFSSARYLGRPLVLNEIMLQNNPIATNGMTIARPLVAFSLLCLLAIYQFSKQPFSKILDGILFFSVGTMGCLVIFLWFFTLHTSTKSNLNVFWALPTHIFYPLLKARAKQEYARVSFAITALFLASMPFLPQHFPLAIVPILVLVLVRLWDELKRPSAMFHVEHLN